MVSKDEEEEIDFNAENGIVSSFQSYAAEGDILAKQGNTLKAIEAYTKALVLRPADKNCLVARSKCFLQLGDSHSALMDADASLTSDGDFFKASGVFQKAEALYSQGDFELALVYYHRGNKFRPELDEFRLGIQKASEAIDNSIGNPKDYKFQPPPGARLVITAPTTTAPVHKGGVADVSFLSGVWKVTAPINDKQKDVKVKSGKSAKQLLGELYADREYLEDFVNDKDFSTNPNAKVKDLVDDALKYLETRTEFWRQQRPIYARKRQINRYPVKRVLHNGQNDAAAPSSTQPSVTVKDPTASAPVSEGKKNSKSMARASPSAPIAFKIPREKPKALLSPPKIIKPTSRQIVDTALFHINHSLENCDYTTALRKTKALLGKIGELSADLGDLSRLQAELYDIQAGIHLKLGSLSEAVAMFKKEADVATLSNITDCIIRSHTEMGKLYTRLHKEARAIQSFEVVLDLLATSEEQSVPVNVEMAIIHHELAKAYYNIKNYGRAVQYGEKAIEMADALNHIALAMNSRIIVAQSQVLLKDYAYAVDIFSSALNLAKRIGDKGPLLLIWRSLDDAKRLKGDVPV